MSFEVNLTLPPSINQAFTDGMQGRRIKSEPYRKWKWAATRTILETVSWKQRVGGPISVNIEVPLKMRGDIDNRIKPILDALVESKRIDDDKHVHEIRIFRALSDANRTRVVVTPVLWPKMPLD